MKWYTRAAEQGHTGAEFNLGKMYEQGKGVPQDNKMAVKWYRRVADGDENVATPRGYFADWKRGRFEQDRDRFESDGDGVKKYVSFNVVWVSYKASAQAALGNMYEHGQGVPQDYKTAVNWYTLAAENPSYDVNWLVGHGGHADAQFKLGRMYEEGKGVPQDDKAAVKWYALAAKIPKPGHAGAVAILGTRYFKLANRYSKGQGVQQDDKAAFKWYDLAAKQIILTPRSSWAECTSKEKALRRMFIALLTGTHVRLNTVMLTRSSIKVGCTNKNKGITAFFTIISVR